MTSKNDKEENWDDKPLSPPRGTPPGAKSTCSSQENNWRLMADQDPHPDSVAGESGHGTMTIETEPVTDNEELIGAVGGTDENSSTQHHSDIEWNDEDLLIEINDENVTIHQTPAASLTPVPVLNKSEMLSPQESPGAKKPCFRELTAPLLLKSAPPLCLKPDYSDAKLVGYTWPSLTSVIPWIKYEAQNMMTLICRHEPQCIREDNHIQYIVAMLVWFCQWKQDHGQWPLLPACDFQFGAMATATIKTQVVSVVKETEITQGEMQALRVHTTLQYLAEVSPKSPPAGQIAQNVQLIMRPLQQADISFMPLAVLGYAVSTQSRGASVETDVLFADISSLPQSVGWAGDMPQLGDQPKPEDYEFAMGEMTLESASSTGAIEPNIEAVKQNLETEAQEDGVDEK